MTIEDILSRYDEKIAGMALVIREFLLKEKGILQNCLEALVKCMGMQR